MVMYTTCYQCEQLLDLFAKRALVIRSGQQVFFGLGWGPARSTRAISKVVSRLSKRFSSW